MVQRSRLPRTLPTPALRRLWRVPRMIAHLFHGLATIWFVFPSLDAHARRSRIPGGSRRRLHLKGVDIRIRGALAHRFAFGLLGRHVRRGVGTLFVERARRHDTHRVNQEIAQALAEGDIVAVFPEGTVTDGTEVLPFKGSLLQPVVDAHGRVQPVALRYRTPDGQPSRVPAYTGQTTFLESFWRICGARALVVELQAIVPLPAQATHRRELARQAEAIIRTVLDSPATSPAPGTSGDPPAAPR